MKVATIKLKDMDLNQVNDFLRFVFNERDIEVLDPDISFTITTVRDQKDKLADKMGGSGAYRFYINAFDKDDRLIYSSGIEFDFTTSDFRYANIAHKLLSSDNPCFQIVKHKDIDFDEISLQRHICLLKLKSAFLTKNRWTKCLKSTTDLRPCQSKSLRTNLIKTIRE